MTRCSTPSSRKAFRISTKCGFIQFPSGQGPRLLGRLPAQFDPLRGGECGVIGPGLRAADPPDPDGPRRPVLSASGDALLRLVIRLGLRGSRFMHATTTRRQCAFMGPGSIGAGCRFHAVRRLLGRPGTFFRARASNRLGDLVGSPCACNRPRPGSEGIVGARGPPSIVTVIIRGVSSCQPLRTASSPPVWRWRAA